eukprot:6138040-Amphidinium_carterae.3
MQSATFATHSRAYVVRSETAIYPPSVHSFKGQLLAAGLEQGAVVVLDFPSLETFAKRSHVKSVCERWDQLYRREIQVPCPFRRLSHVKDYRGDLEPTADVKFSGEVAFSPLLPQSELRIHWCNSHYSSLSHFCWFVAYCSQKVVWTYLSWTFRF